MKSLWSFYRNPFPSFHVLLFLSLTAILLAGCVKPGEPELSQEEVSPPIELARSPSRLEIQPLESPLRVGDTYTLSARVQDDLDQGPGTFAITWTSENPVTADVNPEGIVTALAPGTTIITASSGDLTSSVQVEVITPPPAQKKAPAVSAKKKKKQKRKQTGPKSARDFPCDPLMISAATGECAGTGDPMKFAGEAERAGLADHPLALELSDLPKDRYGLIDWATAIKEKKVKPLDSLNPKAKLTPPLDLDIAIFTKSQFQPDVIFPHYVHTLWLSCVNCHPGIFPMNAKLANKMMTMPKIVAGEFCGRCHNRVAFPLSDCLRCHVKPKDVPPIDPNYRGASKKK